jgi:pimeloyl-ACP methyl ester carboxylesterase
MMRACIKVFGGLLALTLSATDALASPQPVQKSLNSPNPALGAGVSVPFFSELERLARIVDISYCVGNSGVGKPFNCVSRCKEFPSLELVNTWNTGILLSDSCGYIAVDHGQRRDQAANPHRRPGGREEVGKRAIFVAFRGTYSITNTVVDLSTTPQKYTPYPSPEHGGDEPPEDPQHACHNCTVHLGFLQSWQSARELVLPELIALKEQYPAYPVHLVGHSLGGAVACLAALELKVALGWDDVVVTTYGEPRLGNHHMARFIDEVFELDGDTDLEQRSFRRVTHYNDPVPLLPPEEWGYEPHAGEIYIKKESLSPSESDVYACVGDKDARCSSGFDALTAETADSLGQLDEDDLTEEPPQDSSVFPVRFKLWQIFFAHRDYFWRLGLCLPGGDPWNWGRHPYDLIGGDEL